MLLVTVSVLRVCLPVKATYFSYVVVVAAAVVVVVVSRYMHTSLMGVVLTSPYIPTSTLWLKE